MNELPVLDLADALERVEGDRAFFLELIDIMLSQFEAGSADLKSSIDKADATGLRSAAHTLKGALANLGAKRSAAVALELEKAGAAGNLSGTAEMSKRLQDEFELLRIEFEKFRSAKS